LTGTEILDNTAGQWGGGVFVASGSATLSGTQILGNTTDGHGGGMYVYDESATVNMSAGQISDNTTALYGGGVYVRNGTVRLTETQVLSNTAGDKGGGLYVDNGSATLSKTQILNNTAGDRGGGLFVLQGSAKLIGGQVSANTATTYHGGGVYISSGSAVLTKTRILNNTAGQWGGGMLVASGSAMLSGTQILSNTAGNEGGGIYLSSSVGALNMTDGCLVNNSDTGVYKVVTGTLAVTDTWWGAPSGPYTGLSGSGVGDSVSTGVITSAFKTSAPAGCPSLQSDLAIIKTAVSPVARPDGKITYILTFSNAGPHTARRVILTDSLPVEVSYLAHTASVPVTHTRSGVNHIWLVTSMGLIAGEEQVITLTGQITSELPVNHVFTNTVEITSSTYERYLENNQASAKAVHYAHTTYLPLVLKDNNRMMSRRSLLQVDFDSDMGSFVYADDTFRDMNSATPGNLVITSVSPDTGRR
jgi:uncharacterized repeat protein (TIGR01451 family)